MSRPPKTVSVFTDYICPFCYVGHRRVQKLREAAAVDIDWRFMEIHPETPAEGMPVEKLGYPPEQWAQMMANLARMAARENIVMAQRSFTTNSHRALLLAEATRQHAPDAFETLNEALYAAYFTDARNIGDPEVLCEVARESGVPQAVVDRAWTDPALEERLAENQMLAAQMGVSGTPTFYAEGQMLAGAVPLGMLLELVMEIQAPG